MPKFILHPIVITGKYIEKNSGPPEGTLQVYVGRLLVGHCEPVLRADKYDFDSYESIMISRKRATIEEIEEHVILSLKEHASRFIKGIAK